MGNNYNILIVEDTAFINDSVKRTLQRFHYNIEQAFTLSEATQKLSEHSFDLILLDLNLPDGSGFDLVNNISILSNAKIIILTTETDIKQRESLFKEGILDYIVKDKYFNEAVGDIHNTIKKLQRNHKSNILVIDDSRFIQNHIKNILSVRNYNVIPAVTSLDGLNILEKQDINMIILDMELPDIHGLQLLRQLRKNKLYNEIPVMIISSHHNAELVRDTFKAGAFDFIQKPFHIEELVLKVDLSIEADRKNIEIKSHQKILDEYKDAVDCSSIVSKTDTQGIITYVNDKFCDITGYTQSELIGITHQIIRHEDEQDSIFKELWETIKSKNTWSGKLKNRTKNGGYFYAETVISPILDSQNNIMEYMTIRTDITELENIKNELEKNLNISNKNLTDVYKRSLEYQKALNESNILSRTDTSGVITYVNNAFCTLSGYREEELIGKTHQIIKDPLTPQSVYKDLWKTITSKKVWKGQLKNRAKNGQFYYLETTITPIMNDKDEIEEYIAIRHDVTDIVTFHKDLEETQKEVIFRMGEIGESRSKETGFHVKRVAEYSRLLGQLYGLSKEETDVLYSASPMHDIGKVGIPDAILKKPGKLDKDEWTIMMTHAEIGYNILKDSKRSILQAAATIAYEHHEKWDGTGYPNAKSADDIHIYGRITALADVFDALGSKRCYKEAWSDEEIISYVKEQEGKQFDPKLVELFINHIDIFSVIKEKYKEVVV